MIWLQGVEVVLFACYPIIVCPIALYQFSLIHSVCSISTVVSWVGLSVCQEPLLSLRETVYLSGRGAPSPPPPTLQLRLIAAYANGGCLFCSELNLKIVIDLAYFHFAARPK